MAAFESLPWVVAIVDRGAGPLTFGFGDALIGMPLLALFLSPPLGDPPHGLRRPDTSSAPPRPRVAPSQVPKAPSTSSSPARRIPFGLFILKRINKRAVNAVLAAVIILFALYNLFRPGLLRLRTERSSWAFGFAAGILGAAYNTNGPPVILYGVLQVETRDVPGHAPGILPPDGDSHPDRPGDRRTLERPGLQGLLLSLPLIVLAVLAGTALAQKIHPSRFNQAVHILMLAAGRSC